MQVIKQYLVPFVFNIHIFFKMKFEIFHFWTRTVIGIKGLIMHLQTKWKVNLASNCMYYQNGHYKKVVFLTHCPKFYWRLLQGIIHLPNLFFAVNMSSGAAKCLSSLPSPTVLVDSSGSVGCSALGLCEYNPWLLNLQTLVSRHKLKACLASSWSHKCRLTWNVAARSSCFSAVLERAFQ